jgi:transposase
MSGILEMERMKVPSCGIDVHKDKLDACVIDEKGKKHQKTFDAMRRSLYRLRDWLSSLGCINVLMESTGVYWIPIYELLEEVAGMNVGVGNARHMKQVPGRPKTDKADADWISRLCMLGLILKSFVVGRRFRELKEYTRYHKKLVQERARQVNRIEKLLQMNGFKLSSVLSDIAGLSGMRLLKKLRDQGCVTLEDVMACRDGRVKKTAEEIEHAINGKMKSTSRLLLGKMLSKLENNTNEVEEIKKMMTEMSQPHWSSVQIIESIPGIGELSAMYVIAEIGTDMSAFKKTNHITSWAGLAPKDNESAGKRKQSQTQKANIYIKSILVECAWAVTRTRNTRLSNWYWSNVKRLGEKKAITAVARKLLVYIYVMLKSGELYDSSLDVADTQKRKALKLESANNIIAHSSNAAAAQGHHTNNEQCISEQMASMPRSVGNIPEMIKPINTKKRGRPRKVATLDMMPENQQGR